MLTSLVKLSPRHPPPEKLESPEEAFKRIYQEQKAEPAPEIAPPQVSVIAKQPVEVACVPCSVGHFSTSAGLLNEAIRFKKDGMGSREVLDRIAKVLEEQNALERVDLTPEKLQSTPEWERALAEEALVESRRLRHKLEAIESIEQLEEIAANTETFYKDLSAAWFKQKLETKGITEAKFEEMKATAAQRAAEEVEKEVIASGEQQSST